MHSDTATAQLPLVSGGGVASAHAGGCASSCDPAPSRGCGSSGAPGAVETLIDRFLAEQASLTAVERFSRDHDDAQVPAQARYYRNLMPATPPGPGQQYAFEVDLDACTGCKACVTACHSLNGLDEDETWRSVGLLVGDDAFQQHVTTTCHHCVEPGCLAGCPVDAYDKDPVTGIVRHLDDQCIGCGYCTLTCPYEVPRYDRDRGIVRKCDLCADRLAEGEAPACVQACPTQAISVRVVDVDAVRAESRSAWPIPSPAPSRTVPTTTYRSERDLATARAADLHTVRASPAHPPLAVMLVLTQFAVGTYLVDLAARWLGPGEAATREAAPSAVVALAVAVIALGASLLHLGRPHYAYRAVIGLRHSWLSREIVAFSGFAGLAGVDALARLVGAQQPLLAVGVPLLAAAAGVAGVACSAMVYAVTGKRWWRLRTTGIRFALTTLAGGVATVLATMSATAWASGAHLAAVTRPLAQTLAAIVLTKVAAEASLVVRHRAGPATSELARTARLLTGELATTTRWRFCLALLAGVLLPIWLVALGRPPQPDAGGATLVGIATVLTLCAGELIERWQFFRAVSARRMPGGLG